MQTVVFDSRERQAKTGTVQQVKLSPSQFRSKACHHLDQAKDEVTFARLECPECVALGDKWVQLRICMVCGHVGSAA